MKIFTFTLMLLLFSACQKDDPAPLDPCANISCLNGGFCANGECNCPPAYTGSNCSLEKTPTSITITRITITKWPPTEPNGAGWDFLDGPDLTFTVEAAGQEIYTTNMFQEDAVQGQQYFFNTLIELDNPSGAHEITILDYDDGFSPDYMGSIVFNPYINGEKFPVEKTLDNGAVAFRLQMSYSFN